MQFSRKIALPVAASAGVVSLLLSTGGAAYAATAQARSPLPSCVRWHLSSSGVTDHLSVTNGCGGGHWLKVILAHHKDSKCMYYAPGETWRWSWKWPGKFSSLHNC
jgi:hypothetical protein